MPLLLKDLEESKICKQHNCPVEFWCSHPACLTRNNYAVCMKCLSEHMHHASMMVCEKHLRRAMRQYAESIGQQQQ